MNDEQKAKMEKSIEDIIGLPLYDSNSQELTKVNEHIKASMGDIIDAFIQEVCGNCEFSCNESHCDKRHNN